MRVGLCAYRGGDVALIDGWQPVAVVPNPLTDGIALPEGTLK
jgi:hypothetical protein